MVDVCRFYCLAHNPKIAKPIMDLSQRSIEVEFIETCVCPNR